MKTIVEIINTIGTHGNIDMIVAWYRTCEKFDVFKLLSYDELEDIEFKMLYKTNPDEFSIALVKIAYHNIADKIINVINTSLEA